MNASTLTHPGLPNYRFESHNIKWVAIQSDIYLAGGYEAVAFCDRAFLISYAKIEIDSATGREKLIGYTTVRPACFGERSEAEITLTSLETLFPVSAQSSPSPVSQLVEEPQAIPSP